MPVTAQSNHYITRVTIIGAGAIGSFAGPLIARNPRVTSITVIDHDSFDQTNLRSQDITRKDVGSAKAKVLARRMKAARPELEVKAIVDWIENVPIGELRSSLILTCLDSKAARAYVNDVVHRLGLYWVDAGVDTRDCLIRLNSFHGGAGLACYLCGLGDLSSQDMNQKTMCRTGAPATDAPPGLGAAAAGLQVLEADKLLRNELETSLIGRQLVLCASTQMHYVSDLPVNPDCLCDHTPATIRPLSFGPDDLTLGMALNLERSANDTTPVTLSVPNKVFVTQMMCDDCEDSIELLRLQGRYARSHQRCTCSGPLNPNGYHNLGGINSDRITERQRGFKLRRLGFKPGDVFTLTRGDSVTHYELTIPGQTGVVDGDHRRSA